jgi:hypothetical protein
MTFLITFWGLFLPTGKAPFKASLVCSDPNPDRYEEGDGLIERKRYVSVKRDGDRGHKEEKSSTLY